MEFDKIAVICLLTACRIISVLTFRKYVLLPFSGRVSLFQLVAKVTDGGRFFFFSLCEKFANIWNIQSYW